MIRQVLKAIGEALSARLNKARAGDFRAQVDGFVTSYCNQIHDVDTGAPVNHTCVVIPTEALTAERLGHAAEARRIIVRSGTLRYHRGISRGAVK